MSGTHAEHELEFLNGLEGRVCGTIREARRAVFGSSAPLTRLSDRDRASRESQSSSFEASSSVSPRTEQPAKQRIGRGVDVDLTRLVAQLDADRDAS
jgi:hypothetical protein